MDHMPKCDKLPSLDDFKFFSSNNSEFHLKIKEFFLTSRDQPILNKNGASLKLYFFD